MSAMGVKIDQFAVPVCNSFQAKLLNDHICYEVDLNNYSDKNNIQRELNLGFHFILDNNKDRQVTFLSSNISELKSDQDFSIYFNTIGKYVFKI